MGLSLLAGPANAGKVALLLERYLARLDDEPFLIVPNRSDVDRVERDLLRRRAAERLQSDLDAWHGEPVFAYGFEDLTAAEWSLLEALAGRAEVDVSLPYEPGRVAFASLRRTAEDLAALADGRTTELPTRSSEYAAPALAHLERTLFERTPTDPPSPAGAVRFLEGAGTRDTLELVAHEVLGLLRGGVAAERIALVVPTADRFRAPLETALTGFGVPYALEARRRLGSTPAGETSRLDLRCFGAATTLLGELEDWQRLAGALGPEELIAALERVEVSSSRPEPGRVVVLDLLRARTRRFDVVFVLGLEEGSLPRRERSSPFLDDDERRALGRRLERPDAVSRDRYLFYTACTRAIDRLYLVREAATDDGSPREASPFWHEVAAAFEAHEVARATTRRPLSQLTWPLEAAPTERERVRALVRLAADRDQADLAFALADSNDWSRRLERARRAFDRDARLRNPVVLAALGGRAMFGATELERFVDCSSAWLFERVVDPKTIDAEADALLRGKVAHQALYTFYGGLPKELGSDRVTSDNLDAALAFLERCLDEALRGGVRLELGDVVAAELRESLWRDLERFAREEARAEGALLPRRFEIGFGSERSAPELQRGLELGDGLFLSGKIDRIDVDPFSARGIVQDYKSGKGSHSARQIDAEQRLQIPLYMLVLRDLVGMEPLGGIYRALSGSRGARGMLRAEARDELPGFADRDYLDEVAFWEQVERARARALGAARRIRTGDVAHDPRGGECPSWCGLWTMCRVGRART